MYVLYAITIPKLLVQPMKYELYLCNASFQNVRVHFPHPFFFLLNPLNYPLKSNSALVKILQWTSQQTSRCSTVMRSTSTKEVRQICTREKAFCVVIPIYRISFQERLKLLISILVPGENLPIFPGFLIGFQLVFNLHCINYFVICIN